MRKGYQATAKTPEHTDMDTDKDTSPPTSKVKKLDVDPPGAAHTRRVPNAYDAAATSGVGIPEVMLWRSTLFTIRKPQSGMMKNWHEQPMTNAILLSFT